MKLFPTKDISEKELARTLEFIEKSGELARPQKPIEVIAKEVMLSCFGWPADGLASDGYKRARAAIILLETQSKIECDWSPGKRLIAVNYKRGSSTIETELSALEIPPPKTQNVPRDDLTIADREVAATRRILAQMKPRGQIAREAEIVKRGDRNEHWAHVSFLKLIEVLIREFPGIVLNGRCDRSGRHNPHKGRIDLQDHYGQDFAFHLTTRHPNGPIIKGYMIYDSKGSKRDVEVFNENIVYCSGQSGALLKKAIWANVALSSRKDFVREVVSDCISVGLLPKTFDIEALLNFFED